MQFEHGGDIYRLAETLKKREGKIMDFSAPINPLGVPESVILEIKNNMRYLNNYPDPDAKELRSAIAKHNNVEPRSILCGNGSIELIYLIAKTLKPAKALIPSPTFSEYERACKVNRKVKITDYRLKREDGFGINPDKFISMMKSGACSMAFLCNPNNPTGKSLKKEQVLEIADKAKKLGCYLVVDEAFMDFSEEGTIMNEVKNNPCLIVLRSMTKFYALAGLRIGYGVFPEGLTETMKKFKEPWTVNTLAQRCAVAALKDKTYRTKTRGLIKKEKRFLEKGFKKANVEYVPTDANFYLLKIIGPYFAQKLAKKGILIRNCSNFRGLDDTYIRVAVKSRKENTVLLKELLEGLTHER